MIPAFGAGGLLLLATGSIWLGSFLGSKKPEPKDDDTDETLDLTWWQIVMMPVSSSIFLLLIFYYFAYIQYILLLFIVLGSGLSCVEVMQSSIAAFAPSMKGIISYAFSIVFTMYMILQWASNGSFIAHNFLGCCLCISSIAMIRFPSLKLAAVCLGLLFLYDIFWVFFSEYIFSKNVMVEVATKSAANPLQAVGVLLKIPILEASQPKLELPIKLLMSASLFPVPGSRVMMLGLGDIALPGFLVSLARRCDIDQRYRKTLPRSSTDYIKENEAKGSISLRESPNLFEYGLVGYVVGLLMAFYIGSISGHAQPALIYLVPGVLIPVAIRAWQKKILLDVWNGPMKESD